MFRKKINKGLGQFKLLGLYSNEKLLREWIFHFRAITYQYIVQARTDREPKRATSVDSMIANHYETLRRNKLDELKEVKTPEERRRVQYSLIGLRAFRDSNRKLVENVRKSNKEQVDAS